MQLNYQIHGQGSTIVLIHGLFGSLDNLNYLASSLVNNHQVIQIDLRNHGLSPHSDKMSIPLMVEDIQQLLLSLSIQQAIIIGHSLGGKVAMALTAYIPTIISHLIVIDIAPVSYPEQRHNSIFEALKAVIEAKVVQRNDAAKIMQRYLNDSSTILFLLKSFNRGQWRFNVTALALNYAEISGWQEIPVWPKPTLFICGQLSNYVKASDKEDIRRQFPCAKAHIISGAGHWVHAEKPLETWRAIERFIKSNKYNQ